MFVAIKNKQCAHAAYEPAATTCFFFYFWFDSIRISTFKNNVLMLHLYMHVK